MTGQLARGDGDDAVLERELGAPELGDVAARVEQDRPAGTDGREQPGRDRGTALHAGDRSQDQHRSGRRRGPSHGTTLPS